MAVANDASVAVTPATGRRMTLAGVAAVVTFVASLVTLAAMAAGSFPLPAAAAADVARYLTENGGAVQVSALLQAVPAVLLVVFAAGLATADPTGQRTAVSDLVLAAGTAAGVAGVTSAAVAAVMAEPAVAGQADLVKALALLAFLLGGPVQVGWFCPLVGAAAVLLTRTRQIPRWLGTAGTVVAVLAGTSILALAVYPASVAIPLGRFLTFGWILAVVPILLWRTRPGTRQPRPNGR